MQGSSTLSIESLRRGNRRAFAQMVEEYSPKLYRLSLRMLDDPQEAEDALQETFLQAFRGIADFEGRSSLGTWLYRIAVNQALMRLRRTKPELVSVEDPTAGSDGNEAPLELKDWCCLPEEDFMTAEAQSQLDLAISGLSSSLRAVFVLRDLQGLSTAETSEVLSISEAAVKTRLMRARLHLRNALSEYFNERVSEAE
jgi:RNA polymerase sigma-70 factor (ECF subfamily)